MKNLKSKVIMSAIVLVFALIATIGSTYAWFTVSSTVAVSSVDLDVTTEESLLIKVKQTGESEVEGQLIDDYSFTADAFYNNITNTILTDAGTDYANLLSWQLTPVTCVSGEVGGNTEYTGFNLEAFRRVDLDTTATRAYLGTAPSANSTNGGYIKLEFWLMTQTGVDTAIQLSNLTVTSGDNAALPNAIYFGTLAQTETTQNVFPGVPASNDWGFEFFNTDAGYSATAALNTIPAGTITTLQAAESAVNTDTVVTLTANTPELVSVYIWIEGWDAQSTNNIMGDTFSISFSFTIA